MGVIVPINSCPLLLTVGLCFIVSNLYFYLHHDANPLDTYHACVPDNERVWTKQYHQYNSYMTSLIFMYLTIDFYLSPFFCLNIQAWCWLTIFLVVFINLVIGMSLNIEQYLFSSILSFLVFFFPPWCVLS